MKQYLAMMRHVREHGAEKGDRTGTGTLRVVSYNGGPVRSTLGGRSLDGFPVSIDAEKFELSLYPYGRIRLVDAAGTHEGQFEDWHLI